MKGKSLVLFFVSFFIVALGQPAWYGFLSPLAAIFGYALFWYALNDIKNERNKLKISFFWYFIINSVHLSWMTSTEYQGPYILLVYLFILVGVSLQFTFLTYFVCTKKTTILNGVFVSSIWTIMEWSRLFFISGFSWNPAAMAYAHYLLPMQIASIAGVLGMSYYVIFGNYIFYRALIYKKHWPLVIVVATAPYLFGLANLSLRHGDSPFLKAILVQTALLPNEKNNFSFHSLSLIKQWERILFFLKETKDDADLIVLPEVAVPGGANRFEYLLEDVKQIWIEKFGKDSIENLSDLTEEYAFFASDNLWYVNNKFWAKSLSNQFQANVIIGLDELDFKRGESFNAAFFFDHNLKQSKRYIKRMLVPIGEYFPFEWCKSIAEKLGIFDSFVAGRQAVVFPGAANIAVSICYEETFSNIIRESRLLNANLFVNISNDVWFPNSKLIWQHFHHGKLRAVENGVPLLRACNTGLTGGVDCFGKVIKTLGSKYKEPEKIKGALHIKIPLLNFKTLYTFLGDGFIVGSSFLLSFLMIRYSRLNRT